MAARRRLYQRPTRGLLIDGDGMFVSRRRINLWLRFQILLTHGVLRLNAADLAATVMDRYNLRRRDFPTVNKTLSLMMGVYSESVIFSRHNIWHVAQ